MNEVLTVMAWVIGLLAFMAVLMVSIGLHEAGHMYVAKMFKLKVPKFFIGFGPTLWAKKTKATSYGLKLIPLGGFVEIEDGRVTKTSHHEKLEEKVSLLTEQVNEKKASLKNKELSDSSKVSIQEDLKKLDAELREAKKEYAPIYDAYLHEKGLLSRVSPWKRILVFAAGPAVNLVLGFVILVGVLMAYPSLHVGTSVESVNNCSTIETGETCGAEKAGLMADDKIVAIDGNEISDVSQISPNLEGKTEASITVEREGSRETILVPVENGMIGINLNTYEKALTFTESVETLGTIMVANLEAIAALPAKLPGVVENIFGAPKDPEAPSSIVHVGKVYGDTSASELPTGDKVQALLTYSGLLNFSLGFLNLFIPLLPLDGGRILIALFDSIKIGYSKLLKRKYNPVGIDTVKAMTVTMMIPVVTFMGLLIISDVLNIGRGWM